MWTRALLKTNAKQVLSRTLQTTLLVTLVTTVLSGTASSTTTATTTVENAQNIYQQISPDMLAIVLALAGGASLLGILYNVFVYTPIVVGSKRYYMEARMGKAPFSTLFSIFRRGDYGHVVFVGFMTRLKIVLYTLLLIVPGIIKSYAFTLVPYLMAENPQLTHKRAQQISQQVMVGEKFNYFVLEISFIGWSMVIAMITSLLAVVFWPLAFLASMLMSVVLAAYMEATKAEFYAAMREKAFVMNYTDSTELGNFVAY